MPQVYLWRQEHSVIHRKAIHRDTIEIVAVTQASRKQQRPQYSQESLCLLADLRFHLRRFLAFSEAAAAEHGSRAQHYQLLQVIATAPAKRPVTIAYVAERMILRHNSAVELVDRAEQEGHLVREDDPVDHRRTLLRITPQGEQLVAALLEVHLHGLRELAPDLMKSLRALAPALHVVSHLKPSGMAPPSITSSQGKRSKP